MIAFAAAAAVAVVATLMVVTRAHAVHALLYLIVSLLAVAIVFFLLGAPFAAALEVIVYAGAIMVLFVFVVMLLNLDTAAACREAALLRPGMWVGPGILALVLLVELAVVLGPMRSSSRIVAVPPFQVGFLLFGPYLVGVELASFLLLAGLVGALHIGRRDRAEGGEP